MKESLTRIMYEYTGTTAVKNTAVAVKNTAVVCGSKIRAHHDNSGVAENSPPPRSWADLHRHTSNPLSWPDPPSLVVCSSVGARTPPCARDWRGLEVQRCRALEI